MRSRIVFIMVFLGFVILAFNGMFSGRGNGMPDGLVFIIAIVIVIIAVFFAANVSEKFEPAPQIKQDPNKEKWLKSLNGKQQTDENAAILNKFLLKDNIDFDKYARNNIGNQLFREFGRNIFDSAKLSTEPEMQAVLDARNNCTPTFKKYFTKKDKHRTPGFPEWFFIGYPDVVIWIQESMFYEGDEFELLHMGFDGFNGNKAEFFRYAIDLYKQNEVLECAV